MTDEQKRDLVLIATVGCDRATAAKYVGCGEEQLSAYLAQDTRLAADVHRAEAGCELAHMRSVQQASRDERHWRASVWWLERRAPERYGRRDADTVGRRELVRFLSGVAGCVAEAVHCDEDRRRVLDALTNLAGTLTDPFSTDGLVEDTDTTAESSSDN